MKAPKFIKWKDSNGLHMRLKNGEYYRDGGLWSTGFKIVGDKIYSVFPSMPRLHNKELIECTEEEWLEDNKGYVPKKY
jgi:hypothetical protein